jgi:hypothetical protein
MGILEEQVRRENDKGMNENTYSTGSSCGILESLSVTLDCPDDPSGKVACQ